MWKVWEPIIRKKAGLGVLDLTFKPEYYDKAYLFTDLAVVIGAGPAGLHAALTAANAGAKVSAHRATAWSWAVSLTYARFDIAGIRADALRRELLFAAQWRSTPIFASSTPKPPATPGSPTITCR